MKRPHRPLRVQRETLRSLGAIDLSAAGGLAYSNPAVSCDSCTGCGCKPPS